MKKLFLVLVCTLLLVGCGHVKLSNGENEIVSFKDVESISSDDLYKALKDKEGLNTLVNLIDTKLLNKLYETTSEEKDYINSQIKSVKESAKSMNADVDLYLSYYYGVSSESAYREQLSLNYKRDLWAHDYAKESVTDKEISDYYENYYTGDIDAKHILITIDASSSASSDEKTEAENNAFDKASEVIDKLKSGEKFEDLVKTYSKDASTSKKDGSLGKINVGDYDDDVFNALKDMEVNTYSTTPVKSTYGYHILYKVSQDEKPELNDEVKDKIRTVIGSEHEEESNFTAKALIELRKKYNMNITDNELKDNYDKNYTVNE